MRALLAGAGGQLRRTVARVLADGFDVIASTRADLDITDEPRVRAAVADARPGVIVNCAVYNCRTASSRRPASRWRTGGTRWRVTRGPV